MDIQENTRKPTTIVIFGASGDLSHRKLIPSLFNLRRKGRIPDDVRIVGFSTREWTNAEFRKTAYDGVKQYATFKFDEDEWNSFEQLLTYLPGDFSKIENFKRLRDRLKKIEGESANRLYYLAAPPDFYEPILHNLGEVGLVNEEECWRRVIVEKPYGHDLESARRLNAAVHKILREDQIYRIDHYLGKETVQNILVFRFANTIFEPLWNRNLIDHVQITVAETVGVGHRTKYYDSVGVLRDMFQNHLFQLLTLFSMEPPGSSSAEAFRNERVKVLQSIRPVSQENIQDYLIVGQYDGYCSEEGVASESNTPTFAAIKFYIDNWRWQGVPFYIRSGKYLAQKTTEIIVQFKCPPVVMFPLKEDYRMSPNILSLCLQPDEGIHLVFEVKKPDTPAEMRPVDMEFLYAEDFGQHAIPEAYERLLLDAFNGDPSLFIRSDSIELAWGLIDPFTRAVEGHGNPPLNTYPRGSWGPLESDLFMEKDGRAWINYCIKQ